MAAQDRAMKKARLTTQSDILFGPCNKLKHIVPTPTPAPPTYPTTDAWNLKHHDML